MTPGRWSLRSALYWITPSLLCLLLYWRGFTAWFRADDFVWLGLTLGVHNFRDLLEKLFLPGAQGTFRPLSERAFFMAGFALFGLDSLPFRLVIFATQFANLVLVAVIGNRLTGRRAAGFAAAVLWVMNGALIEPLGWVCVYNQVVAAFFLLLAFYFLLRSVEAHGVGDPRTGRRFEIFQWAAFLAGFGAQELNLVYPALAAVYTFLCARNRFRRTLPMFAVSILYVVGHNIMAPIQQSGDYAMHFTGGVFRTLARYWTWSVGPVFLQTAFDWPVWMVGTAVALLTLGWLAFLAGRLRAGAWAALFCLAWYVITIAPVLPLRDHLTEYYVYVPLIGICWLGGWAVASVADAGKGIRLATVVLVLLYGSLVVPRAVKGSTWNYRLTVRARNLVEGIAYAHRLHPRQAILLDGVDSDLFYNAVLDHSWRLVGTEKVYLTPGSDRQIEAHADLGDVTEFILPADVAANALQHGEAVVYDVRGPELRNITASYSAAPVRSQLPLRVEAGNSMDAYLLGTGWYPDDGGHRWTGQKAVIRLGAPPAGGEKLYLHGNVTEEQMRAGAIQVSVMVNGAPLPPQSIQPGTVTFDLAYPLPDSAVGKPELQVTIAVSRTYRPPQDGRDLGLAFGWVEIR